MTRRNKKTGYVYLLKDNGGRIKVGVSTQPFERFSQIKTSIPDLEFYGIIKSNQVYEYEKILHSRLASLSIGREWFSPEDDVLKVVFNSIATEGHEYGVCQVLMYPNPDNLRHWKT